MLRYCVICRQLSQETSNRSAPLMQSTVSNGFLFFKKEVMKRFESMERASQVSDSIKQAAVLQLWRQLSPSIRSRYDCATTRHRLIKTAVHNLRFKRNSKHIKRQSVKQIKKGTVAAKLSAQKNALSLMSNRYNAESQNTLTLCTHIDKHDSEHGFNNRQVNLPPHWEISKLSKTEMQKLCSTCSNQESFNTFYFPNMKYFSSFTEMQRSVAPTRREGYVAVCLALIPHAQNSSTAKELAQQFDELTMEEQNLFRPIAENESVKFELFSAHHAAGMSAENFNILWIFVQFRKIVENLNGASNDVKNLFKSLLYVDRVHDGLYFKVRRNLERLWQCRSSDCGWYINNFQHKRQNSATQIHPSTYQLIEGVDEVAVSTALAETRINHSVYDDALERAAVLRSQCNLKALMLYNVKDKVEPQLHKCKFEWIPTLNIEQTINNKMLKRTLEKEQENFNKVEKEERERWRQKQLQVRESQKIQKKAPTPITTEICLKENENIDTSVTVDSTNDMDISNYNTYNDSEVDADVFTDNSEINTDEYDESVSNNNFNNDNKVVYGKFKHNIIEDSAASNVKFMRNEQKDNIHTSIFGGKPRREKDHKEKGKKLIKGRVTTLVTTQHNYDRKRNVLSNSLRKRQSKVEDIVNENTLLKSSANKTTKPHKAMTTNSLFRAKQQVTRLRNRNALSKNKTIEKQKRQTRGNNYTAIMEQEATMDKLDERKLTASILEKGKTYHDTQSIRSSLGDNVVNKANNLLVVPRMTAATNNINERNHITKNISKLLSLTKAEEHIQTSREPGTRHNKAHSDMNNKFSISRYKENGSTMGKTLNASQPNHTKQDTAYYNKKQESRDYSGLDNVAATTPNYLNNNNVDLVARKLSMIKQNELSNEEINRSIRISPAKDKIKNRSKETPISEPLPSSSSSSSSSSSLQRIVKSKNKESMNVVENAKKLSNINRQRQELELNPLSKERNLTSRKSYSKNAKTKESESMQRLRKALLLSKNDAPVLIQSERHTPQRYHRAEMLNYNEKSNEYVKSKNGLQPNINDAELLSIPQFVTNNEHLSFTDQVRSHLTGIM